MFQKDSAFSWKDVSPPLPGTRPDGLPLVLGSTRKLGVVEIPVDQLENWYAILNELAHSASRKDDEELLEVRDQVYSYLRG